MRIRGEIKLRRFHFSGRPKPTVTWSRRGQVVEAESEVSSGTTVTSTLMLVDLKRSDNEGVITCEAKNNNISTPVFTSVTLLMNRKNFVLFEKPVLLPGKFYSRFI